MCGEVLFREDIEWTNTWWEHANDLTCSRILMIGDSVTRGIRPRLHALVKPRYVVDLFATSLQVTDPLLEKEFDFHFSIKEYSCDRVIIQEGGQHGFDRKCSEDPLYYERFQENYINLIARVEKFCRNIIFLSSTATVLPESLTELNRKRNEEIQARNKIVKDVADIKGYQYVNIYSLTETCKHIDQIHMDSGSYEKIALEIAKIL